MDKRIAVVFHRIGPYHFARLRAAGKLLQTTAIELSNQDITYAWDKVEGAESFKRVTLFDQDVRTQPESEINRRIHSALSECQPSAVAVNGWATAEVFAAHSWCLKNDVPAIVMSESTAWDEQRVSWKEWVKGRVVRLCSAGFAGGAPHAQYLAKLGMDSKKIAVGYDAVDNDYFKRESDKARANQSELRARHKLPERYFLASARFIAKKNLSRLLEAYALYRQRALESSGLKSQPTSLPWPLVLLGDGPLQPSLNAQLSTLNLQSHVLMPGFKQYPELPIYYGLAGAFVHASTSEQWGLVVNEAMAAGLPVVVSNRCGCAQDLVKEGVNGFTFDPNDARQLSELMLQLTLSQPSAANLQLSPMGLASREIISQWGPDRFASGLKTAVDIALSTPRPRATLADRLLLNLLVRRRSRTEN